MSFPPEFQKCDDCRRKDRDDYHLCAGCKHNREAIRNLRSPVFGSALWLSELRLATGLGVLMALLFITAFDPLEKIVLTALGVSALCHWLMLPLDLWVLYRTLRGGDS